MSDVRTAGPLAGALVTLLGGEPGDWFGMSGAIGDFDADGFDDLAVGIPRDVYFAFDQPGRVAIFRGPLSAGTLTLDDAIAVWTARDVPDSFGFHLAAGDVDTDGRADLVIGAPFAGPSQTGMAVLLPSAGLDAPEGR